MCTSLIRFFSHSRPVRVQRSLVYSVFIVVLCFFSVHTFFGAIYFPAQRIDNELNRDVAAKRDCFFGKGPNNNRIDRTPNAIVLRTPRLFRLLRKNKIRTVVPFVCIIFENICRGRPVLYRSFVLLNSLKKINWAHFSVNWKILDRFVSYAWIIL